MAKFDITKVDVEDFLSALRIRNMERADLDNWRFSCPFPGHNFGDDSPSAYMHEENTAFYCHGCKRHGNAISFLAEYEGVSELEARRWLREEYDAVFREPSGGAEAEWIADRRAAERREASVQQTYLDESVMDRFRVDWADAWCEWSATKYTTGPLGYMFRRGFEPEEMMDWEVGYDDMGERFAIPIREADGRLVGFKGRAWDRERKPKYLALGDKPGRRPRYGFPTFEKSLVVYGLHRAARTGRLVVVEGEINTWAMHGHGHPDSCAIAGSDLSDAQCRAIRGFADEAVLLFDTLREDGTPDLAGITAAWGWISEKDGRYHPGAVDKLERYMPVRVCPRHEGDPNEMDTDEVDWCLDNAKGSVQERAHVRIPVLGSR